MLSRIRRPDCCCDIQEGPQADVFYHFHDALKIRSQHELAVSSDGFQHLQVADQARRVEGRFAGKEGTGRSSLKRRRECDSRGIKAAAANDRDKHKRTCPHSFFPSFQIQCGRNHIDINRATFFIISRPYRLPHLSRWKRILMRLITGIQTRLLACCVNGNSRQLTR